MKVLLINPPFSLIDRYGKAMARVGPCSLPFGLAYIASVIEKNSYDLEVLDLGAQPELMKKLDNFLKNTDVVGITMMTPMYDRVVDLTNYIKKLNKNIRVIVGGSHPSIMPELTLEDIPSVDFVVYGEGEITIVELLKAIEKKLSYRKVKGLCYRHNGKIIKNPPREFIENLDNYSSPARHLFPMKLYRPAIDYYRELPSYFVMLARGCPFNCSYCSQPLGKGYRHYSVNRAIEEIEQMINKYKVKEIIFRDDTFAVNRKFVNELCDELIKKKINEKMKWSCSTRVDTVDKDLLLRMKKAGCWQIYFGVESGSQRLIDVINKNITLAQVRKTFSLCRKIGISTLAYFMMGLPSETRKESLKTIEFAKKLDPNWVQFTITVPYPGTKLYKIAEKDGTLKSKNWSEFLTWAGWADRDLIFVPKGRTSEELKKLQKKAMRDFYLRIPVLWRMFKNLIRYPSLLKGYLDGAWVLSKSVSWKGYKDEI